MITEIFNDIGTFGIVATCAAGAAAFFVWMLIGLVFGDAALAGFRVPEDENAPLNGNDRLARLLTQVGQAAPWVAGLAPRHAARLERLLEISSRPLGPMPGGTYLSATFVLGAVLSLVVFASIEGLRRGGFMGDQTLATVALSAGLLFVLTQFVAWYLIYALAQHVTEEITLSFPFYLDLAVLTIRAGSLPLQTFEFYIEAEPRSFLAREFRITLREAEALGVEEALGKMAARLNAPPVEGILRNLSQAQRTSGSISQFYAEQAVELRTLRKEIADAAIDRMRVNLKVCEFTLMGAIMLAVGAPVIAELEKMF